MKPLPDTPRAADVNTDITQARRSRRVAPLSQVAAYLTERELAEYLNVSVAAIRRWRLRGEGPRFHKFCALVRYSVADVEAWAESRRQGGGS